LVPFAAVGAVATPVKVVVPLTDRLAPVILPEVLKVPAILAPVLVTTTTFPTPATVVVTLPFAYTATLELPDSNISLPLASFLIVKLLVPADPKPSHAYLLAAPRG
jgi:hypothetical protein